MYDKNVFKSVRFDFPVISVGNLTAGGTGKTLHIEYLIFLLHYSYKVATLSRGYGRSSHGYVEAETNTATAQIGDEPKQFKTKFPETIVTVCEDRIFGVPKILSDHPETDVILLDDAFQHRSIRPGLSILITEYNNLFTNDYLIPVGWLRESRSSYHRADVIIVSKCPANISQEAKQKVLNDIKPFRYQKVYFSAIQYGNLYSFNDSSAKLELKKDTDVLLVCAIARFEELKSYLSGKANHVYVRDYRDHHRFDRYDLEAIRETFNNLGDRKKVIITTEKDAARLDEHRDWFMQNKIEIFVQPIEVKFLPGEAEVFNADILNYIETTKQKISSQQTGA